MKVLIIGLGSIAKKHISVLKKIIPDVSILALRSSNSGRVDERIDDIYTWPEVPDDLDFIIISNPTSLHADTILKSMEFEVPLFIEKPVLHSLEKSDEIIREVRNKDILTYTACNLRFHPAIQFLKKEFQENVPIEYNSYCGSYLPEWRPNTDYREVYSSKRELGGGVHLDLIHEVDYCKYLFGNPIKSISYYRKKSNLEINSADIAHFIFEYEKTSSFITLNYYRRVSKRDIECVWDDKIWIIDLLSNSIKDDEGKVIYSQTYDIMDTYYAQMKHFVKCVFDKKMPKNNIEEGIETLKLVLNE